MGTEEDNFDIDIYGEDGEDYHGEEHTGVSEQIITDIPVQASDATASAEIINGVAEPPGNDNNSIPDDKLQDEKVVKDEPLTTIQGQDDDHQSNDVERQIGSIDASTLDPLHPPKQAPQTQGLKRKDGADDRYVGPGATAALFIADLHWWITDDDICGWVNQCECEDELEDLTFNEHKVNGKSKGQAYVVLKTPQAATAVKHKIESFGEGQKYKQKFVVSFTNPYTNPFKCLPKDGPMRNNNVSNRSTSKADRSTNPAMQSGYVSRQRHGAYSRGSGGGGYNRAGFQPPVPGNYQGPPMNGFQGSPMGGMQPYGGFQNHGGIMGNMRGDPMDIHNTRETIGPNGMMGMPMGGMGMGGMPVQNMGMGGMGPGIGMQASPGYQPAQPHYNPAFFPPQHAAQGGMGDPSWTQHGGMGETNWNPHGAKRTRQE